MTFVHRGVTVAITTTAKYGVIGFGGMAVSARGLGGILALLALSSGGLLWRGGCLGWIQIQVYVDIDSWKGTA